MALGPAAPAEQRIIPMMGWAYTRHPSLEIREPDLSFAFNLVV
jgi:hypothetical protein